VAKDFVVRLRCPYGDEDQLLVLQDRDETLSQILDTAWDFECPVHGVQREIPVHGSEKRKASASRPQRNESAAAISEAPKPRSSNRISLHVPVLVYGWGKGEGSFHEDTTTLLVNASGGLVSLASKVGLGDTIFVVNKATQQEQECRVAYVGAELQGKIRVGVAFKRQAPSFWRIDRKELRIRKSLRVWVRGLDRHGQKFAQSAHAVDVSQQGARMDGIGYLTWPGETIEVSYRWRKARFRVVWVGDIGTPQAGQAGLYSLEPSKNIWGIR
jgi:hypothetical protein